LYDCCECSLRLTPCRELSTMLEPHTPADGPVV
jgi:hypothetical protein